MPAPQAQQYRSVLVRYKVRPLLPRSVSSLPKPSIPSGMMCVRMHPRLLRYDAANDRLSQLRGAVRESRSSSSSPGSSADLGQQREQTFGVATAAASIAPSVPEVRAIIEQLAQPIEDEEKAERIEQIVIEKSLEEAGIPPTMENVEQVEQNTEIASEAIALEQAAASAVAEEERAEVPDVLRDLSNEVVLEFLKPNASDPEEVRKAKELLTRPIKLQQATLAAKQSAKQATAAALRAQTASRQTQTLTSGASSSAAPPAPPPPPPPVPPVTSPNAPLTPSAGTVSRGSYLQQMLSRFTTPRKRQRSPGEIVAEQAERGEVPLRGRQPQEQETSSPRLYKRARRSISAFVDSVAQSAKTALSPKPVPLTEIDRKQIETEFIALLKERDDIPRTIQQLKAQLSQPGTAADTESLIAKIVIEEKRLLAVKVRLEQLKQEVELLTRPKTLLERSTVARVALNQILPVFLLGASLKNALIVVLSYYAWRSLTQGYSRFTVVAEQSRTPRWIVKLLQIIGSLLQNPYTAQYGQTLIALYVSRTSFVRNLQPFLVGLLDSIIEMTDRRRPELQQTQATQASAAQNTWEEGFASDE